MTSGLRWFLRCNFFVLRAREAGAGLRRAREASGAVERWLEHRCPRNNTWHRPKLFDRLRDRSVRTQCTSLSHGGARAPEEMWVQLSEDKTASTISCHFTSCSDKRCFFGQDFCVDPAFSISLMAYSPARPPGSKRMLCVYVCESRHLD